MMTKNTAETGSKTPADRDLDTLEKIRWSLRQRLCEHMRRLNTDLFDEIDDFLFSVVQPEKLVDGSTQLKLIREFRNKKQLFEEKFLSSMDSALQSSLVTDTPDRVSPSVAESGQKKASPYQRMETDLAMERMKRRAFKFYATQINELGSSGRGAEDSDEDQVIPENRDLLIDNTLRALASSHEVFRISLDSRLVFFKLFEKHFLLNMEKLYQDVISIISKKNNREFVDRLYSSSTSIHQRWEKQKVSKNTSGEEEQRDQTPLRASEQVEQQVNEVVEGWCENSRLPDFVEKMIRNTWHSVLFLMGLNSGVESAEWLEAKQTIVALLAQLDSPEESDGISLGLGEIRERLQQGFELSHLPEAEQQAFFARLQELRSSDNENQSTSLISKEADSQASSRLRGSFASVSEAGRKILDNNDLDDFVALLSDDQAQEVAATDEEAISMDYYLNMVDTMAESVKAQFKGNTGISSCRVQKSATIENSYQVLDPEGNVLLTRSRVGLAVSLRAGEIRLDGQEDFKPARLAGQLSVVQAPAAAGRPTTH